MTVAQIYEDYAQPLKADFVPGTTLPKARELPPLPKDGQSRVVIENVAPQIDEGRHPAKRTIGEKFFVEADLFSDSHVSLSAVIKFRPVDGADWAESPMERAVNDRWRGEFTATKTGEFVFTIEAWVDRFKSWRDDFRKRISAGQNLVLELQAGARLIQDAASRADGQTAERLKQWSEELVKEGTSPRLALDDTLGTMVIQHSERTFATSLGRELRVIVEPERARFSAWYEMFPRSCSSEAGRHGTFKDCQAQLPRIAKMGFDVLYFPPIHPIGESFRKGKNNNPECQPGEPGSPWAIGAAEGGHKAVHPQLGTLEDFRELINEARKLGIEIAMDVAFQCSPDHPYLREHPGWFRKRADGSIAYAENPPKKYQDIYPFDFECDDWRALWTELKSIFDYWIDQGIRIFRVDNPHTKSFAFWEWCLRALKHDHADLIFLAEAFTRPAVMNRLAKIGFSQSYNYFPWRTSKSELTAYFTELTSPPLADYLRSNLWPNTPDILPEHLQMGGRPMFEMRLILAATLGASYGIYGPAYELCEDKPLKPGTEEYLDSEKYEIRHWDLNAPGNLTDLIARVNRIRHENEALQFNHTLKFYPVDNENILVYTKSTEDGSDIVLVVVNLDPYHTQSGWVELPGKGLLDNPLKSCQMHDLLTGARFVWHGVRNYIELDPNYSPAHIFRLRRYIRTERDFDYFM